MIEATPERIRARNSWPRWTLAVQIAAVRPYGVSFAASTASSKSATLCSVAIGPNSSVQAISDSSGAFSISVGAM